MELGLLELFRLKLRLRREGRIFLRYQGYPLDIHDPRSYNEKLVWRKFFDRNPLFVTFCDKLASRRYVLERLGRDTGEAVLIPLLFEGNDPDAIPFDDLPEQYIVKPSHGSGWSVIVDGGRPADREAIVASCKSWLGQTYGEEQGEWAYSLVPPLIMVEKLLREDSGRLAPDYKLFVFGGKVHVVYVLHDRFGDPTEAFYDRDFVRQAVRGLDKPAGAASRPPQWETLVELAERLAEGTDFLRVDLYLVDGRVYFGEFTAYPGSGYYHYTPVEFEQRLGEYWELDRRFARELPFWL